MRARGIFGIQLDGLERRLSSMIDSHIHLDADQYADPSATIKRAREAGVRAIVVPGVSPASNHKVLALARRFDGFVRAALGFHPEHEELTDDDLETTVATIRRERERIVAVGEVGMPWYGDGARDPARVARATRVLETMAALARELDLALILHAPHQSAADALAIARVAGVKRGVFHWHKSDETSTRAILDAGYFISLTPEVVYRQRDRELAKLVPLSHLVVETDGPWQYGGAFTGQPTGPWMIRDAIEAIAEIKSIAFKIAADGIIENTSALFSTGR
jgi:TatD DNase family protein